MFLYYVFIAFPQEIMETFGCAEFYNYYYYHTRNNTLFIIYCSILGIIIAVFYYLLRPDFDDRNLVEDEKKMLETMQAILMFHLDGTRITDEDIDKIVGVQFKMKKEIANYRFKAWWKNGRTAVFIIFILTTASVVSLLAMSYTLTAVYLVQPENLCKFDNTPASSFFLTVLSLIMIYAVTRLNIDGEITKRDKEKLEALYYDTKSGSKQEQERLKEKYSTGEKGKNCCFFSESKEKITPAGAESISR